MDKIVKLYDVEDDGIRLLEIELTEEGYISLNLVNKDGESWPPPAFIVVIREELLKAIDFLLH